MYKPQLNLNSRFRHGMLKRCFDTCGKDGQETINIRFRDFSCGLSAFCKSILTRFTNFCVVASDTYFATRAHFGTSDWRTSLFVETVVACTACLLTVGTGAVTIGALFSEFGHVWRNWNARIFCQQNWEGKRIKPIIKAIFSSLVLFVLFDFFFGAIWQETL